jgi:hypothetical protein
MCLEPVPEKDWAPMIGHTQAYMTGHSNSRS